MEVACLVLHWGNREVLANEKKNIKVLMKWLEKLADSTMVDVNSFDDDDLLGEDEINKLSECDDPFVDETTGEHLPTVEADSIGNLRAVLALKKPIRYEGPNMDLTIETRKYSHEMTTF